MTAAQATILDTIGNTSLLPLRHVVASNGTRILLKLESENPTGSMKDRMALAMVEAPEADGRLQPGGAVVEYTGGSTGVSLALVCAVKRHLLHIVTSVRPGDELRVECEVLEARPSKSRPQQGLIKIRTTTLNQDDGCTTCFADSNHHKDTWKVIIENGSFRSG